ncbi:diphosphomevalonate decarboxylase [Candidatus Gottesmanbacteria bacterium RIFCSPLOWO2_01_FULL_43_11b]|uniref:diphosphomevalonate decarboxylase n=1 Tax=Candidatus Gottesmanbacteria bacterium RIFCSPLOWO2_01_FULL_43_11b TaxID=1798392 RepID=A0A1F6AHA5_9BACT|nr:MAG: diphosphomevalonate decarboxylase [Candidatus Gottesmanbacteria bacterium RIFCSPLOWO2_01_FULL_43_11b]
MKVTAIAPANIAFIKYWGRKDAKLRIPSNPSISMNLSACITKTTVEFSNDFKQDTVTKGFDEKRIIAHIDRIRDLAKTKMRAKITTNNSFPTSVGVASSASGFAALTVAAAAALGLKLSPKKLSSLARLGSGSACRSIPDGFVKWEGEYAYSLYPHDYWDLRDILVIVESKQKEISSSKGHEAVETSPFFAKRLAMIPKRIKWIEKALGEKNFPAFGKVIEEDCLDMHHVMQTQDPPLIYWNDKTREIMDTVRRWRKEGIPVYFTIDAGANVHLICEGKDERKVIETLGSRYQIIINKPARGAHLI